jgi:hypothetical protein
MQIKGSQRNVVYIFALTNSAIVYDANNYHRSPAKNIQLVCWLPFIVPILPIACQYTASIVDLIADGKAAT